MMHQGEALRLLETAGVPLLHLDVMDGQAWPKITAGASFLAGLKTDMLKDVHLLVRQPEKQIPALVAAGADLISFCAQQTDDLAAALALIGDSTNVNDPARPILRGVSLNPDAPLEWIRPHLEQIDFVVLLAVGPDTGKTSFLDRLPDKIATLRQWKPELLLAVDGAVTRDTIGGIAALGPDWIVSGSAVFDGHDPAANLEAMRTAIQTARPTTPTT
jgi:ribulose-phosphate 3-epimerase